MTAIPDKQFRLVGIHDNPPGWKISPYERDCIYQEYLRAFPTRENRRAILKECRDNVMFAQAMEFFDRVAKRYPVSSARIHDFVSQAVATEEGYLPKAERWDWWVGCSLLESNSASSAPLR